MSKCNTLREVLRGAAYIIVIELYFLISSYYTHSKSLSHPPFIMGSHISEPTQKTIVQLPAPFDGIPREPFLFGVSPIQYLPNITKALGGKVGIYAKREDCNSGLAFGGNKVRKLEYVQIILVITAIG